MKKLLVILSFLFSISCYAQLPLYYQSNYLRVVQPETPSDPNSKPDTLVNPYTGGMTNPMFFKIDMNGDGISDLFIFDRDVGENQFLNFLSAGKNSIQYYFTPFYESAFPKDLYQWTSLADYNKDGLPDIFTHSSTNSTGVKVYRNTSYTDAITKKFTLRFNAFKDTLFTYDAQNNPTAINLPGVSNPWFGDVDGDGYMDIVSFDINLNSLQWYRNEGKNKDSLKFYMTDKCWGKFQVSAPHFYTPWDCSETGTYDPLHHKNGAIHGYSSLCLMDVDGDGDQDALIGDGGNDSLVLLENGKTFNKNNRDTVINISFTKNDNKFPPDNPVAIETMPLASNLDVDNDGVKDLLISTGMPTDTDTYHTTRSNNIWYYHNVGDTVTPVLKMISKDFLQNTTVDWGMNSAPCFIDVDKDGRKDLIVAVRDGGAVHGYSHLVLYLNKAGKPGSKPYLLFQTDDYLGLSSYSKPIGRPVPCGYLNGKDLKTDFIIGNDSGHVMYYKDRSTGTNPANFQLAQSSLMYLLNGQLTPINVEGNASPTTVDINHDGKTDLLIGANDGRISYYRCLGYGPSPDYIPYFVLVTDKFGGININLIPGLQSAPCVADLNQNGKPDLLVGDKFGKLSYYPDFDTVSTLIAASSSLLYDYRTAQRSTGKLFSTYTVPAVANLDQDSIPDIMLGCRRGGLFFLGSYNNGFELIGKKSGIEEEAQMPKQVDISIYPNPTNDHFTLKYNNSGGSQHATLVITDMLGREVVSHDFIMRDESGNEVVSVSGLVDGIYLANVRLGDGGILRGRKVVVGK